MPDSDLQRAGVSFITESAAPCGAGLPADSWRSRTHARLSVLADGNFPEYRGVAPAFFSLLLCRACVLVPLKLLYLSIAEDGCYLLCFSFAPLFAIVSIAGPQEEFTRVRLP